MHRAHRRADRAHRAALALLGAVAVVVSALVGAAPSGAAVVAVRSDAFVPGAVYTGDFPDPALLRVGDTYYAYATNTGGLHLPAMWSTDLSTWYAHAAWPAQDGSDPSGLNDAMPRVASYAVGHLRRGILVDPVWAPSVAFVHGRYVAAYVVQTHTNPVRRCISLAVSDDPMGPFVDSTTRPLVCSRDTVGSIDPMIYTGPGGASYLLWKNTGVRGVRPPRLKVRRLDRSGTAFRSGTRAHTLLRPGPRWEGGQVENPALVWYSGRLYLFYSGNRWDTARYATGYAVCANLRTSCVRGTGRPLLATGGAVSGPGGAFPIVDPAGALRLAYAAWDYGDVGYLHTAECLATPGDCNQRRMHIATLRVHSGGRLSVAHRG